MRLGVTLDVLNQKGTPALYSDTFVNRPTFGFKGRIFFSTDTGEIFEDTGTAWTILADAGAGTTGTLQQVTTNGNTTTNAIGINNTLSVGTTAIPAGFSNTKLYAGLVAPAESHTYQIGVTGTATANSSDTNIWGVGVYGAGFTNGATRSAGVQGDGEVSATGDTGSAIGVRGYATATHAGGLNIGVLSDASGSSTGNYGYYTNMNASTVNYANYHAGTAISYFGGFININGTGTNDAFLQFQSGGTTKWYIGNSYSAGNNYFKIYNNTLSSNAIQINNSTNQVEFLGNIIAVGIDGSASSNRVQLRGSTQFSYLEFLWTNSAFSNWNFKRNITTNNLIIERCNSGGNVLDIPMSIDNTNGLVTFLNTKATSLYLGTNTSAPTNGFSVSGTSLFGTSTDDTIHKVQINGSAKISTLLGIGVNALGNYPLTLKASSGDVLLTGYSSNGTYRYDSYLDSGSGQLHVRNASCDVYLPQTAGTWVGNSDITIKENIELIPDALNKVMQLNGYTYNLINDKNHSLAGVIAQEVLKVLPQAVHKGYSKNYNREILGVEYDVLSSLLINSTKELKIEKDTEIAELRLQIEELKALINK